MANRSDFFNAKLPRGYKRMMAMAQTNGWVKDSHEYGKIKNLFIDAHANHVRHKLKRNTENRDASEATE
jgi:hypothetical protein